MNILYKIFKGTKVIAEGALCAFSKEEGFRKVYNKAKGKVRPFEYHKLSIEIKKFFSTGLISWAIIGPKPCCFS